MIGGTYHIFLAYFLGLCKGISPQNMAKNMVQYLHFTHESPVSQGSGGGETEEDMQAAPTQKARPVGLKQDPGIPVDQL